MLPIARICKKWIGFLEDLNSSIELLKNIPATKKSKNVFLELLSSEVCVLPSSIVKLEFKYRPLAALHTKPNKMATTKNVKVDNNKAEQSNEVLKLTTTILVQAQK